MSLTSTLRSLNPWYVAPWTVKTWYVKPWHVKPQHVKPRYLNLRRAKNTARQIGRLFSLLIIFYSTAGCEQSTSTSVSIDTPLQKTAAEAHKALQKPYIEKGDLDALKKRKSIRFLHTQRGPLNSLTRHGIPTNTYHELAEEFASEEDLKVIWINHPNIPSMINALEKGEGDVIIANLTQTAERETRIAFSQPFLYAFEHIVTAHNTRPIESAGQLSGKTIAVRSGSSFYQSLQKLRETFPDIDFQLQALEDHGDYDNIIDQLNSGTFDATVMDDNWISVMEGYREDFVKGMAISEARPIAWAMRKNASNTQQALNEFITQKLLTQHQEARFTDDFEAIKKRKKIRMLTRNNPASYFLWRGELMGFDYELVKKFADEHKLLLEVVVAAPDDDIFDMLKKGEGDLIAAAVTVTTDRDTDKVNFTRFYNRIHEQLVTSKKRKPLDTFADLNNRTLVIRQNTSYWKTAMTLEQQFSEEKNFNTESVETPNKLSFELIAAPDDMSTDDILMQVAEGAFDATIADSHLVAIESHFLESLSPGLKIGEAHEHAWVVRESNPTLLTELNAFIKKEYRGLFFNVTYDKYFKNQKRIERYQGQRLKDGRELSPYDSLVKEIAADYQFDWRIVIAQMYQESRFNPKAKSYAGARGLLQVMPRTAKELGYSLPFSPESGIEAGIKYLDWTRERFEPTLPPQERLWFSLAAYNAGFGHVYDARRLAKKQGLNPNKWFGHVEKAMLLLSKKQYYKNARFGYVRGHEPVNYVRSIRNRYNAYSNVE